MDPQTGETILAWQTIFLTTLDISEKAVRTVTEKLTTSRTLKTDLCGHASDHNKLPEEIINRIKDYIKLFKTIESHYNRKDSQCEYLPEYLSISKMHGLYTKWCKTHDYESSSYTIYYNVMKTHFNLSSIRQRRINVTSVGFACTPQQLLSDKMKTEQDKHIVEKTLAQHHKSNIKKEYKSDATVLAAGFDF